MESGETETPTKQPTKKDFIFLSGALALDLLNTEIMWRGERCDLLATPADLANWWQAALAQYKTTIKLQAAPEVFDEALLSAVKELRAELRSLCNRVINQQSINPTELDGLNRLLRLGHHTLETAPDGRLRPVYQTYNRETSGLLLHIALAAFEILVNGEQSRLHQCKNERCILYFYDITKNATRHWCSIGCMNRARSSANYRKTKALQNKLEE